MKILPLTGWQQEGWIQPSNFPPALPQPAKSKPSFPPWCYSPHCVKSICKRRLHRPLFISRLRNIYTSTKCFDIFQVAMFDFVGMQAANIKTLKIRIFSRLAMIFSFHSTVFGKYEFFFTHFYVYRRK